MRGNFLPCKAEEESGLAPADDENAAGRKINRKDVCFLVGEQYYRRITFMKTYHRILAGVLAAVILVPVSSLTASAEAPKVSTDEAVYVNLDYYGKTNKVTVVKGCSLNGNTSFTDYGSYAKVTNMTDETKPVLSGDSVSWNLPKSEERFYYECTPKSNAVAMPWSFDVSYKLNGVPADAAKLAGTSGMVEIDVKATPNKSVSDYYRNNMLLEIGTAFKMKDTLSVEAEGAQVQSVGEYKAVLFAGLPGEEKEYKIRVGTNKFETIGVVMMMVPGTVDQFKEIKDIKDAKDTVEDSLDSIHDSTNELLTTLETMSDGLAQTKSGLASLNSARASISSSKGQVYSSADKALADLTQISNQTSALVPHLQEAQKAVVDVNNSLNATVGKLNTVSTELTDLSVAIGEVRSDVNDIRDNLDGYDGNTAKRKKAAADLAADMKTVSTTSAQLKTGLTGLSAYTTDLTKKTDTLSTTLTALSTTQTGSFNPSAPVMGTAMDYTTIGALKTISAETAPTLKSLENVTTTTAGITTGVSALLGNTDQFLTTGGELTSVVDSYMDELDSGVSNADDLLKDTNKIGASTKNLLSTSQEVIDSITGLNGVMNQYKDGTVDALKDTENLANGITKGLSDSQAFLTSLETLLRTSGSSLDEGTRKSLTGLIDVLQKALDQTKKTSSIKNANNTIKKTVDDKINKYEDENNLLNLDAEAKPVSFTSSKNAAPESIQVIMRTAEISTDNNSQNIKDQELADAYVSPLARIQNLFAKIWQAIVSAFSN